MATQTTYTLYPTIAKAPHKLNDACDVRTPCTAHIRNRAASHSSIPSRTLRDGSINDPPPFQKFGPAQALLPNNLRQSQTLPIPITDQDISYTTIRSSNESIMKRTDDTKVLTGDGRKQTPRRETTRSDTSLSQSDYSLHAYHEFLGNVKIPKTTGGATDSSDLSFFLRTTGPSVTSETPTHVKGRNKATSASKQALRFLKLVHKTSSAPSTNASSRKESSRSARKDSFFSLNRPDDIQNRRDLPYDEGGLVAPLQEEQVPPSWKHVVSKAGKRVMPNCVSARQLLTSHRQEIHRIADP